MTPAEIYDRAHAIRREYLRMKVTTTANFLAVLKLQIERDRLHRVADIANRKQLLQGETRNA